MSKIQQLDATLSNMIAAGEVVERPSAVVKELVENSIDANSSRIVVEIKEGGISYIKVDDNGSGMDNEDTELAFKRHATSKIKTPKDLFEIATLGFRGEALPSIASVSEVRLTTAQEDCLGTVIKIHYGEKIAQEPHSRNQGTTIEVSKLFRNTPARLKHLKNSYYEASRISDVMRKFACSYPHISFKFVSDSKTILETNGSGKIQDVLLQIYDYEVVKKMIVATEKNADFELELYLIQPQFTRKSNSILTYVNHRMVRGYMLQKAVIEGYKQFIPDDRQPIVVMNVNMDYSLVDVNVHPSKWEVRISKENELRVFISETIHRLLTQQYAVPSAREIQKQTYESLQLDLTYQPQPVLDMTNEKTSEYIINEIQYPIEEPSNVQENVNVVENVGTIEKIDTLLEKSTKLENVQPVTTQTTNQTIFHTMNVLAQLQGKYILCESDEGLYIIDQHAAAERINYEKIQKQVLNQTFSQQMLVPYSIMLTPQQQLQSQRIIEELQKLNIEAELFTDQRIVIRAIPSWIMEEKQKMLIEDLISEIVKDKKLEESQLRKYAIATAACHHSIRFNRRLSKEEMVHLVFELSQCEHPYHCPHGRTVVILIDNKRLEKDFMRIM